MVAEQALPVGLKLDRIVRKATCEVVPRLWFELVTRTCALTYLPQLFCSVGASCRIVRRKNVRGGGRFLLLGNTQNILDKLCLIYEGFPGFPCCTSTTNCPYCRRGWGSCIPLHCWMNHLVTEWLPDLSYVLTWAQVLCYSGEVLTAQLPELEMETPLG